MKIKTVRSPLPDRTPGDVYVDGAWFCYSLEDPDRRLEDGGTKIPKETAIPRGTYRVIIDWSARFKKYMLHLLDVPQFIGVRAHGGNVVGNTEGCPLLGAERTANGIRNCGPTVQRLQGWVQAALDRGEEVTWEVV